MKPLAEHIWMNGRVTPWADAKVHVMTHALHYGTSVFEGIRVYDTPRGPCGFRLDDHMSRLVDSARMYGITLPYSAGELVAATKTVVHKNGLKSAAMCGPSHSWANAAWASRRSDEAMQVDVAIAAFPWSAYLGDDGQKNGIDVCVSSWARFAPNTVPTAAKAGGNYLNGYLIGREARMRGFVDGIALGTDGRLSEGAGENLFVVKDGRIFTPPAASSILIGITRDTVMTLAKEEGFCGRSWSRFCRAKSSTSPTKCSSPARRRR